MALPTLRAELRSGDAELPLLELRQDIVSRRGRRAPRWSFLRVMSRRFTVRRVFNKQVVVAGGELLSRELLERTATGKSIGLTVTVHSKKKGVIEKKLSITELARACGFEDAIFFASQREAKRYILLIAAMRSGKIEELARQHEFKLHAVNPEGLKVHVCSYYADFTYLERGGCRRVFEDSKGMPDPVYEIKRKWLFAEYGIAIREV
jgi:hypothetical protein